MVFGEKMAFHMVCFILFIYLETAHSTAQAGLELTTLFQPPMWMELRACPTMPSCPSSSQTRLVSL